MGMYASDIKQVVDLAKSRVWASRDALLKANPQKTPRRSNFDVAKLLADAEAQYPPELWIGPKGEQVFGSAFIIYMNTPVVKNGKALLDRAERISGGGADGGFPL